MAQLLRQSANRGLAEISWNALTWIIYNPLRKQGTGMKSLAYADGYEKQSVFERVFVMSFALHKLMRLNR